MGISTVYGELVVDTAKQLKFTVTSDDVSTGQPRLSRDCPGNHGLCRAMNSALPEIDFHDIRMHLSRTYVRMPAATAAEQFGAKVPPAEAGNFVWLRFTNAPGLRDQVYSMDKHKKFNPGEYLLWVPNPPPKRRKSKEHRAKLARSMQGTRQRSLSGVRKWGVNR